MASIIIQSIGFLTNPDGPQTIDIKYKHAGDPEVPASYTQVSTNLVVPVSGDLDPDVEISGLTMGNSYTIVITNKCSGKSKTIVIPVEEETTFAWIEDVWVCEEEDLIALVSTFGGLSSPSKILFNETNGKMYVADLDNVNGLIWSFDPATFTNIPADKTYYVNTFSSIYDGSISIDRERKRFYIAGHNTNGLIAFDTTTNQIEGTVPYGANTAFGRLLVTLQGDYIYCSYSAGATNSLTIIDAETLTLSSTLATSSIPSGTTYLNGGYSLTAVEGNIWAAPAAGRTGGNIAIYNASFTSLVGTITLTGSLNIGGWGAGKFWGAGFYDEEKDRYYYFDTGSCKLFVINTLTNTVLSTTDFNNRAGKDYATAAFQLSEPTNTIFLAFNAIDSSSDGSPDQRTYLIDRDTNSIKYILPNLYLGFAEPQIGSSFLWAASAGLPIWSGGSWATDGVITKLTY
jgi:DNA-binding beta-propeller fold protein YncE